MHKKAGGLPEGTYKKWLEEDVRWIITDQERADFKKLADDKERDRFIAEFWERRNPTPGRSRNIVKEEHYQRLAYVDQHFSEDVPGWKTDRGRVYIMWGPPDDIERWSRFQGSQANSPRARLIPRSGAGPTLRVSDAMSLSNLKPAPKAANTTLRRDTASLDHGGNPTPIA